MKHALALLLLALAPLAGAVAAPFVGDDTGAPPMVRILAPASGVGGAGVLRLEGVAEDPDTTVEDVQVRVDRGAWTSVDVAVRSLPAGRWSHDLDLDALPPGEHLVEVRATDGGFASAPAALRVASDFGNAPPSLRLLAPEDGAGVDPEAPVTVRVAADDADGTVEAVEVRLDGGAWRAASSDGSAWSSTFRGLDAGVHVVEARARDDRGARSVVLAARFAVGAAGAPPVVRIATPLPGQGVASDDAVGCIAVFPCLVVTGTTDAPTARVFVSVDGGPEAVAVAVPVGTPVGSTWRYEWRTSLAFAGPHTFRVRAVTPAGDASVPAEVVVELASPRGVGVRLTPSVVRTNEPFNARVASQEALASVAWIVDGSPVAEGPAADLRIARSGVHEIVARVRDRDGWSGVAIGVVQVIDRAPEADLHASPGVARVGQAVAFDASGTTDADGRVTAWRFDFGDGAATPWLDRPEAEHVYRRKGAFVARVDVRDEAGSVASATRPVVVENTPPFVTILPSARRPAANDTVRFEAQVADPDDRTFVHLWDFPDGTQQTGALVAYVFGRAGPAEVAVEVRDRDGGVGRARYVVDVQGVAPAVDFALVPPEPTTRDVVRFDAKAADVDGRIVGLRWDFGDGNVSMLTTPYHSWAREGNYVVRLEATDDSGLVSAHERLVRVGNSAPLVEFVWEPAFPSIADDVVFTGRAGDLEGNVTDLVWALEGEVVAAGERFVQRFPLRRAYNVSLLATDEAGAVGSLTRTVRVVNGLPRVVVPDVVAAHVGETVALQALATDADGAVVEVRWDADGDGVDDHVGLGRTLAWTYAHAGIYHASFTAVDDLGAVVSASVRVEVTYPPPSDDPPEVTVLSPVDGAVLSGPARLEGLASDDFAVQLVEWQVRDGAGCPTSPSGSAENGTSGCEDVYPGGGGWASATGVSPWTATLDTRVLANGVHTLVARAWDGNQWSEADVRTFTTVNDPQETPTVALQVLVPAPGSRLAGVVTLQGASFHPQGVRRVLVAIDGEDPVPANGTASWSLPWDTRNASAGEHTVTVRAELASGLYRLTRFKVHVNNDPPTLYVRPVGTAPVAGLLHLRGNVAVDREAEVVRVRVDDGPWQEAVGTTRWSWSVDTRTLADGPHEIEVVAVGSDGLASWPSRIQIVVANGAPAPPPEPPLESPAGAWLAAVAALAFAARRTRRV